MENLLSIKNRISTVDSIVKATNAMKMVSSIKLSRMNTINKLSKDCSSCLFEMLSSLLKDLIFTQYLDKEHYLFPHQGTKKLILVFSTEQGFCGAFNQNILNEAEKIIKLNKNSIVKVFGKKGKYIADKEDLIDIPNRYDISSFSRIVINLIIKTLKQYEISEVIAISGHFKNVLIQYPESTKVFPFTTPNEEPNFIETDTFNKLELLEKLFQSYMHKLFNTIITEHITAELSARVMAMDNSVKNAKDMVKELNSIYNRSRQDKITRELTEIVASIDSSSV